MVLVRFADGTTDMLSPDTQVLPARGGWSGPVEAEGWGIHTVTLAQARRERGADLLFVWTRKAEQWLLARVETYEEQIARLEHVEHVEQFAACERPMLIAVDYDGTYSVDPEFFRVVVRAGTAVGHRFVMVTGRSDEGQWGVEVRRAVGGLMPIVFAADGWKREAALAAGYEVDVWVDDHPEYVAKQDPAVAARRDGYTAEQKRA